MKKPIFVVVGAFLLSGAAFAQSTLQGSATGVLVPLKGLANCFSFAGVLSQLACQVNGPQQNQCTQTGGVVQMMSLPTGGPQVPMCKCAQGFVFHAPSGGCVKAGAGGLPQTNQPAKRLN